MAVDADGDFVVAWRQLHQDGSDFGVFARRFSSAGTPLGGEFQVNTYTTSGQCYPVGGDGRRRRLRRRLDGAGPGRSQRRLRPPLLERGPAARQRVPGQHLHHERPGAIRRWHGRRRRLRRRLAQLRPGRRDYGIFARRYSSAGARRSTSSRSTPTPPTTQSKPAVAAAGRRRLRRRLVQRPPGRLGLRRLRPALRARRPRSTSTATASRGPLTDGLLVLRYMFGFTGTTLTSRRRRRRCTRCNADAIEPYLAGLGSALDIDGNGAIEPLTDGLLVLRFLFGFTGTALGERGRRRGGLHAVRRGRDRALSCRAPRLSRSSRHSESRSLLASHPSQRRQPVDAGRVLRPLILAQRRRRPCARPRPGAACARPRSAGAARRSRTSRRCGRPRPARSLARRARAARSGEGAPRTRRRPARARDRGRGTARCAAVPSKAHSMTTMRAFWRRCAMVSAPLPTKSR